MSDSFQPYPADPIFSLLPRFQRDVRPQKVNLSIGMYYDEAGELPRLSSVMEATELIGRAPGPSPYLPMAGNPGYCTCVQKLLFGPECTELDAGCIGTIQTLGGSVEGQPGDS